MKTIHKYSLQIVDRQTLEMNEGAEILTVQMQHTELVLWALVDTSNWPSQREILVCGTGLSVHDYFARYIGTVQDHDGAVVWHVFEGSQ